MVLWQHHARYTKVALIELQLSRHDIQFLAHAWLYPTWLSFTNKSISVAFFWASFHETSKLTAQIDIVFC